MKIFRIETDEGIGLYTHKVYDEESNYKRQASRLIDLICNDSLYNLDNHPDGYEEFIYIFEKSHSLPFQEFKKWNFGFANLNQLTNWLSKKHKKTIYQFDLKCFIYDVNNKYVYISEKQCIFRKDFSVRLEEIDLRKL